MATIEKRTGKTGQTSYLIRVFVDENKDGKQKKKAMTWKPAPGMTAKQIEKELNRQATLFEEKIRQGLVSLDGTTRFEDYAAKWLETAELAPSTRNRYEALLVRINAAIGHIKLEKLQGHHLEEFYQNLRESGVKEKGRWAVSTALDAVMLERKLTRDRLAKLAGVAPSTVGVARKGQRISVEKAKEIARALEMNSDDIFQICASTSGLSDKTVLHHHRLISAILSKAKRERIIPFNVATEHATAPKIRKKEANHLNDEQAQQFVQLLFSEEDIRIKTALLLAIFSGVRRGELCGLSWNDIDYKNRQIHIRRASQYQPGKGVVEVPTKNDSSQRSIGLPQELFVVVSEYRRWWSEQRFKNGSKWQGKQNRLFIQEDGSPINPDTITSSPKRTVCNTPTPTPLDIRLLRYR